MEPKVSHQEKPASKPLRALFLEDNRRDVILMASLLEREGFALQFEVTYSLEGFREQLQKAEWDVILADYNLRGWDASDALEALKQSGQDVPLIVVTGSLGDEGAVECLKQGAADFVLKDRPARLPVAIKQALEEKTLRDERKRAEVELRRLNRALRTISNCNQILVRAQSEQELLEAVCQTLVEEGGFRMAWVGYAEQNEARTVRPIAYAGFEEGYLALDQITWGDDYHGQGPTGSAIRSGQPVINRNTQTNSTLKPWRKEALKRGYASSVAIPLRTGSQVLGALSLYAGEPDAFDEAEVKLLSELADNLRFGIDTLRTREKRKRAEDSLRESEERYRTLVENSPLGIYRTTPDGRILAANPAIIRMLGYSSFDEFAEHNLDADDFAPEYSRNQFKETLERQGEITGLEAVWHRRDRKILSIRENARAFRDKSGKILYYEGTVEDITERKQVEEALIEERHLLHTLMDNVPDKMYFKDRESRFTRVNVALARSFELDDPRRAIGKTDFDFFTDEHARQAFRDEQEIIRTGQPVMGMEEKETWPDGRVTWVSTTKMPLRDADGNIIGTFGISRDITERKRAEEALRESEEKYRSLILNIPDVVWSLDPLGRIVFVSPNVKELSGYTAEEFRQGGLTFFFSKIHPEDVQTIQETFQTAFRDGQQHEVEYRAQRKDGQWIWIRARAISSAEKNGVRTLSGLMTDITEHKQREAENLRLVTSIEQSVETVVMTDRQGTIIYVNPAFTRITGYSREEALGQNPRILKSGKQAPEFYAQLWATISSGQIWHGEVTNRRKDGSFYTELMTITPVRGPRGEVTHFIATKQDVTERKLLEEQLRQAQKIEAIGRLAGGVAHDFNNLLTIISGYGELLQERLGPEDLVYLKEILKAGERATSLTRQLLAFSRRQILAPRILDLNSVVAELEKMLRRLIGEDIHLVTVQQPGLGHVKADPGQIEQVIVNLAVNARDAMPQGGKLTIETANVNLDEAYARIHRGMTPGPHVMLAVTDTGMGMDAETQGHIFEPFFTTKEKGMGTGLGLATVYGIVKQSSGYIWVYSEPGRGSTFKIYLPRVDELAPEEEKVRTPPERAGASETILVAEDEEGVRSLVCATLKSQGYKVLEASAPAEAITIAEHFTEPIHMLLTDVVMPHMSGKDMADHVSALHSETKVLFMSGYTDDAVVRHGILEASTSFLQKPFTPISLTQKVREVLDAKPKDPA